jgi:hypothetical protein
MVDLVGPLVGDTEYFMDIFISQLQMHTLDMLCEEVFTAESMIGEASVRVKMAPALCSGIFVASAITCDVSCGADMNAVHGQVTDVANDLSTEQARCTNQRSFVKPTDPLDVVEVVLSLFKPLPVICALERFRAYSAKVRNLILWILVV